MALTFLSPQFLFLLAALPLVVALHFLRSRRTAVDVSALFLWRRAQQVVARRRRFSPTWLLLAQLLFIGLAAFALARPALLANSEPDRVLIIDASASMAARLLPPEGTETRLGAAQAQAAELLTGVSRLALIRAGSEATLLLPLEASLAERQAALAALAVGDASADVGDALALAAALLPEAEIHVFSDQHFELGRALVHVVGEPQPNLGISALDIGIGQVFVGVVSSESRPVEVGVSLWRESESVASGSVLVPANGTGSITFPLPDLTGIIEARLDTGAGDALALDDVAFAGSRPVSVVTDDGHGALTRALAAVPNTAVRFSVGARLLQADLKVLTRGAEGGDQPGNYLVVAPPAPEPRYTVVSDWDRADPLLRFVDLSELVVGLPADWPGWEPDPQWRVLARTSDLRPVMRVRDAGGVFELQLAFHPSQSDFTLRPAFPTLMANVVERLRTTSRVRLGEAPGSELTGAAEGSVEPLLVPGVYRFTAEGLLPVVEAGEASAAGEAAGAERVVLASLLAASESRLPQTGQLVGAAAGTPASTTGAAASTGEAGQTAPGAEPAGAGADARPDAAGGTRVDGGPTTAGLVLLALALFTMLLEWALYSGALDSLARRFGVRSPATR